MRVRLKGTNQITKRLADGSTVTYFYAWKGGPRLEGAPGSPEFVASYQSAHEARKQVPQGTLFSLVAGYRASPDYTKLAEKTRRDYGRYLALIETEFGDMPLRVVQDPRSRGDFLDWRDQFADTPRKADMAATVLAKVLSWARNRGRISVNVMEKAGRLYESDRADKVWTDAQVEAAIAGLPDHLRQPFMLALYSGQRQGDLLRLPWSAYDGNKLRLKQSKTGARVAIPVLPELAAVLAEVPRRGPLILTSSDGRPWTSDGFRSSWGRAMATVGIEGVTFHDLRGTAITRLARVGCTEAEIASWTGHEIGTVSNVIGRYLARSEALAEAAGEKLKRAKVERKLPTDSQPVTVRRLRK